MDLLLSASPVTATGIATGTENEVKAGTDEIRRELERAPFSGEQTDRAGDWGWMGEKGSESHWPRSMEQTSNPMPSIWEWVWDSPLL